MQPIAPQARFLLFADHVADPNRLYPYTITVDGATCVNVGAGDVTAQHVVCSSILTGRVVRLQKTGGDCCLNLCELQIYGKSKASL
jgi:hypothetical protein